MGAARIGGEPLSPAIEADIRRFIQARMPLSSVPDVPEIRLHKADPASGLHRLAERGGARFGIPYWAYHWGGGIALARYLLDHPESVVGKTVIDLGTGSGIVGIAAALAGAKRVTAIDVDAYAAVAASMNAQANGVLVEAQVGDILDGDLPDVDVITAGDMFYDTALADRLLACLARCHANGVRVLIGDPGRAFLPQHGLRWMADYPVRENEGAGGGMKAAIFTLI